MKYLIMFLILFHISCGGYNNPYEDCLHAPSNFTCTDLQMKKVQEETLFCNKNTGFTRPYCYGSSIIRNCKLIKREGNK